MKTFVVGWVITAIAAYIMGLWKGNREVIKTSAQSLDERIEKRFGIEAPAWVHGTWDKLVSLGVTVADKILLDGPFVRNVIRAVAAKDPSKLPDLQEKLKDVNLAGDILAEIPEEYLPFFNQEKENAAVKTVTANMAKVLPAEHIPPEPKIREMVRNAAAANKINEEPVPVTKELLEKMIKDSQERQKKLLGTKPL